MRARMGQRLAAVEGHAGQRRRIARLLEGLGPEDAVDDGARLAGGQSVGSPARVDPGDGDRSSAMNRIDRDHHDGDTAAAPELDGVLAPEPSRRISGAPMPRQSGARR